MITGTGDWKQSPQTSCSAVEQQLAVGSRDQECTAQCSPQIRVVSASGLPGCMHRRSPRQRRWTLAVFSYSVGGVLSLWAAGLSAPPVAVAVHTHTPATYQNSLSASEGKVASSSPSPPPKPTNQGAAVVALASCLSENRARAQEGGRKGREEAESEAGCPN